MLAIQKKLTNTFYALLSLPATAMGFALSIQISALSWILSTKYNLRIDEIGLVWAAGPIAGILGQVIIGIISDNVWMWNGRRRPFILIGGLLSALMLLALPNIDVISATLGLGGILGVAIAVALTLDLAINVSFNPTRSIIADVTPEGVERTKGYTWMQTISGTFGVLAYVIGAVWNNYVLIYFGVGLVLVLSLVPSFFIEEPRELAKGENENAGSTKTKTSVLELLEIIQPLWGFLLYGVYAIVIKLFHIEMTGYAVELFCLVVSLFFVIKIILTPDEDSVKHGGSHLAFKKILAAHSFTWIGIQTMFVYMFAYVQYKVFGFTEGAVIPSSTQVEMGRIVSIGFLIFSAVSAVLPAFILEPIARKIGRVTTHAFCIASMAVSYLLMLLFGLSPIAIYALMALLGIGWASTISLPFAIMSQKVEQSRMGLYMGLFNLSVVLPQLVASFGIGKAVNNAPDKSLIFIISTISLTISAVLWFFIKEDKKPA
jgi:maltose/moltooligosaccharide transporter